MIRANKSPNLRKVSRVARRMQLVSRGTCVGLWNLSLKVPRGTATSPGKRSRDVPRGTNFPRLDSQLDLCGTYPRLQKSLTPQSCSTWNARGHRLSSAASIRDALETRSPFSQVTCSKRTEWRKSDLQICEAYRLGKGGLDFSEICWKSLSFRSLRRHYQLFLVPTSKYRRNE